MGAAKRAQACRPLGESTVFVTFSNDGTAARVELVAGAGHSSVDDDCIVRAFRETKIRDFGGPSRTLSTPVNPQSGR